MHIARAYLAPSDKNTPLFLKIASHMQRRIRIVYAPETAEFNEFCTGVRCLVSMLSSHGRWWSDIHCECVLLQSVRQHRRHKARQRPVDLYQLLQAGLMLSTAHLYCSSVLRLFTFNIEDHGCWFIRPPACLRVFVRAPAYRITEIIADGSRTKFSWSIYFVPRRNR